MEVVVNLESVSKSYTLSGSRIRALDAINLSLPAATMVAVVGPSGSGKSTLLNIIGALDRLDTGKAVIHGKNLAGLNETELTIYRRSTVGFIFQDYGLIPNLTALENVMLLMEFAKVSRPKARERAQALLQLVEMGARATHRPNRLSGGEQQRVAIARALANDPAIILADEPTGNLDSETGKGVVGLLRHLVDEQNQTVIVVSHDDSVAQAADMRFHIKDGCLTEMH